MVLVGVSYLGMGYLFYRIDIGIEAQCNKWRCLLLCLPEEEEATSNFLSHPKAGRVYFWGFVLMLALFICMIILVGQMLLPLEPKGVLPPGGS